MTRDEKLATVDVIRARLRFMRYDHGGWVDIYKDDVGFLLGFLAECAASHDDLSAALHQKEGE